MDVLPWLRRKVDETMKTGFSRSHWRLDRRLVALTILLFALATAVYLCIALRQNPL
jgi:hypothetical protein